MAASRGLDRQISRSRDGHIAPRNRIDIGDAEPVHIQEPDVGEDDVATRRGREDKVAVRLNVGYIEEDLVTHIHIAVQDRFVCVEYDVAEWVGVQCQGRGRGEGGAVADGVVRQVHCSSNPDSQ